MPTAVNRRQALVTASQGLLAASLVAEPRFAAAQNNAVSPTSRVQVPPPRPINLPTLEAETEKHPGPPPALFPPEGRVGFAVVGLGHLTLNQILPAFGQCTRAKCVALVSGDAAKAQEVARQYGIPASSVYSYQNFDTIRDNPAVEVVYIVLPNAMHAEYTVRAAKAGKHVLSEKPMATSVKECQQMVDACNDAHRHLMVAYRIQYEPNHRMLQQIIRSKQMGNTHILEGHNGQNQGDPNQWRQKKALAGGGALPDVGLYCLNTFRFLLGEEPVQVSGWTYATPGDPRFKEIEESCLFQMRFPSGVLASCATGYSHHESRRWRALMDKGWVGMDPAFSYGGLQMHQESGDDVLNRRQMPQLDPKNQFAREMDHMAQCIMEDRRPYTRGEEGLQDQRIMEAIYQSAHDGGKPVSLPTISDLDTFRGPAPDPAA